MKHLGVWAAGGLAAAAALVAVAAPVSAAADEPLLPHPGPDGLLWVPEGTGDGGAVSGGLNSRFPTVVTVACQGGGDVVVTFDVDAAPVSFPVSCPVDEPGKGAVTIEPGLSGSFSVGVDASAGAVRWSLTVVQPEG